MAALVHGSCRVRNWYEYEAGLLKRGDLTVALGCRARCLACSGEREWHMSSGYSKRSMVEVQLASKILNTMTLLGMPNSYKVA